MQTFLAILAALPKLIALIQFFTAMVREAEQRGLGRKEAVAEALEIAHRDLAIGAAAAQEATSRHAKIGDDGAFDSTFRRKDE